MKRVPIRILCLTGALFLVLAACGTANPNPTQPALNPTAPPPTIEPSPTPTALPALVYLQTDPAAEGLSIAPLAQTISDLAAANGLRFQQGAVDDPIPTEASLIFTTAGATGVGELLNQNPQATVVAAAGQPLEAADRLIILGPSGIPFDRAAFVAGYLGALLIPDHRTGMIDQNGASQPDLPRQAYRNGQQYYCGLCRPAYPPFTDYPNFTQLAEGASGQDLAMAIAGLEQQGVRSILLPPLPASSDLWAGLSANDLILIAPIQPPEGISAVDLVIRPAPELAIQQHWTDILDGTVDSPLDIPITIVSMNESQISPARLQLAEEVLQDVNSGFIRVGRTASD